MQGQLLPAGKIIARDHWGNPILVDQDNLRPALSGYEIELAQRYQKSQLPQMQASYQNKVYRFEDLQLEENRTYTPAEFAELLVAHGVTEPQLGIAYSIQAQAKGLIAPRRQTRTMQASGERQRGIKVGDMTASSWDWAPQAPQRQTRKSY